MLYFAENGHFENKFGLGCLMRKLGQRNNGNTKKRNIIKLNIFRHVLYLYINIYSTVGKY